MNTVWSDELARAGLTYEERIAALERSVILLEKILVKRIEKLERRTAQSYGVHADSTPVPEIAEMSRVAIVK